MIEQILRAILKRGGKGTVTDNLLSQTLMISLVRSTKGYCPTVLRLRSIGTCFPRRAA